MKALNNILLIGLSLAYGNAISEATETPNIILILIDGLGRESVSCYGAEQATPNIDQLANDGIRYQTVWSMPACHSSQATLLTGQYPFRHGWTSQDNVARRRIANSNGGQLPTIAQQLRDGGYQTAIGGHWQLNHVSQQSDTLQQQGFDESCIWDQSGVKQIGTHKSELSSVLLINGNREEVDNGAERINAFLTSFTTRSHNRPFFIYYPMLLEGVLRDHAEDKREKSPSKKTNQHAARVKYADQLVGNLISAVDASGLREKTVIVIAGKNVSDFDNTARKEHHAPSHLRISDHGVHVPLIVRAVGMTGNNGVSHDLIDYSDICPTFLELAGLDTADQVIIDGRSFVPSLRGSEDPYTKRNWIYTQHGGTRMIRDWQHVIDNRGNFHDLQKDPLQQQEVSPLDKIAPGRRQRLQMILDRFPKNATGPIPKDSRQDR